MAYTLELDSNFSQYSVDLEYEFNIIQRVNDGRQRNFTTITNQDPEAARHFGFQPGESNPTIEWLIYDNGEDKSNNTLAMSNISDSRFSNDEVTTIEEQIIWLTEYIHDNTSDPRWILNGGRFDDTQVVVQEVNHVQLAGQNVAEATIRLKLGVTV